MQITSKNLQLTKDKTVEMPAPIGIFLGRGFGEFKLASLIPHAYVGNDAFTEVYFTTRSGNLYKIFQTKDRFGNQKDWVLVNVRGNEEYTFSPQELRGSVLEVGRVFHYGGTGSTSEVVAILAVNANRARVNNWRDYSHCDDMQSDIRNEFLK